MFCIACGEEIKDNSKFCEYCGARQSIDRKTKKKPKKIFIDDLSEEEFNYLDDQEKRIVVLTEISITKNSKIYDYLKDVLEKFDKGFYKTKHMSKNLYNDILGTENAQNYPLAKVEIYNTPNKPVQKSPQDFKLEIVQNELDRINRREDRRNLLNVISGMITLILAPFIALGNLVILVIIIVIVVAICMLL